MSAPIYTGGRPFIKPGIRTGNNTGLFNTSSAPTNGTSGTLAGVAGPGSLLMRTNGSVYINTNTKASPTWVSVGVGSSGAVLTNPTIKGVTPIAVTASTVTLGATHVGRTTVLKRAAGLDVTLPAATGSGDKYRIVIGDAGNAYTVVTAPATDFFQGVVIVPDSDDTAPAVPGRAFSSAATSNKMSPTTAGGGGLAGDWMDFEDYASGLWVVSAIFKASSAPATPFSHV
jgi:hypothetical protein